MIRAPLTNSLFGKQVFGGKIFYQDPTFCGTVIIFISLVAKSPKPLYNLSEAGLLMGENIVQSSVEGFFKMAKILFVNPVVKKTSGTSHMASDF